jgi:hypothetical protein
VASPLSIDAQSELLLRGSELLDVNGGLVGKCKSVQEETCPWPSSISTSPRSALLTCSRRHATVTAILHQFRDQHTLPDAMIVMCSCEHLAHGTLAGVLPEGRHCATLVEQQWKSSRLEWFGRDKAVLDIAFSTLECCYHPSRRGTV